MSSKPHTDEIYNEKKKPKNEIKFNITLNQEQKEAKQIVLDNDIVLINGQAGSGKTLLACQIALNSLFRKDVEKIIIARPMVEASQPMGFLPGDEKSKMHPWLLPIYENLYLLSGKEKIEGLIEKGQIEIQPLAYIRGRTFLNAFIIIDESQNATSRETQAIMGRLGRNSKMVFCGDKTQIDLKPKNLSGIDFFTILESNVERLKIVSLKENHRHSIVAEVLEVYKQYE